MAGKRRCGDSVADAAAAKATIGLGAKSYRLPERR